MTLQEFRKRIVWTKWTVDVRWTFTVDLLNWTVGFYIGYFNPHYISIHIGCLIIEYRGKTHE